MGLAWDPTTPDPYPLYHELRERGAVHHFTGSEPGGTWVVVRHATALRLFRDPRFVRNRNHPELRGERAGREARPVRSFGVDLPSSDPPDHTRLRRLVSPAFTGRVVQSLGSRVEALAHERLDAVVRSGRLELIADYAERVPLAITCGLLGLSERSVLGFGWMIDGLSRGTYRGWRRLRLDAHRRRFLRLLEREIEARRRRPCDDLLSDLVRAESEEDRLAPDELQAMVYLLLVAGYLTTTHLMGNAVLALLQHPEQLHWLRADPGRMAGAVEELARYDGPLGLTGALYPLADVTLDGVAIPRGATMRVALLAANRDEAAFTDPERLDLARDPCPHLAFGHGIHYCLGAPLARLELGILLRVLFERLPGLRLAEPVERLQWLDLPTLRGVRRLPLCWGAA